MSSPTHRNQTADDGVHTPISWTFDDSIDRTNFVPASGLPTTAASLASFDVNKFGLQLDDSSVWRLSAISPVTWTAVGGSGGTQTLAQTLALGNITSNHDLIISSGDRLIVSGTLIVPGTLSGSIHNLHNGLSYLVGATNITITSQSNGQVEIKCDATSPLFVDITVNAVVSANLSGYVYTNGDAGEGATLNAGANGTFFSHDGVTPVVGNLYLLPFQTSSEQNGVFRLLLTGSSVATASLIRHFSMDTASKLGDSKVYVRSGNFFKQSRWSLDIAAADIVVGTTPLRYTEHGFVPFGLWTNSSTASGIGEQFMSQEPNTVTAASTKTRGQLVCPCSGVFGGIQAAYGTVLASANGTFKADKNGINQSLFVTVPSGQSGSSETSVSKRFLANPGDLITVTITNDVSDATTSRPKATLYWRPLVP